MRFKRTVTELLSSFVSDDEMRYEVYSYKVQQYLTCLSLRSHFIVVCSP